MTVIPRQFEWGNRGAGSRLRHHANTSTTYLPCHLLILVINEVTAGLRDPPPCTPPPLQSLPVRDGDAREEVSQQVAEAPVVVKGECGQLGGAHETHDEAHLRGGVELNARLRTLEEG